MQCLRVRRRYEHIAPRWHEHALLNEYFAIWRLQPRAYSYQTLHHHNCINRNSRVKQLSSRPSSFHHAHNGSNLPRFRLQSPQRKIRQLHDYAPMLSSLPFVQVPLIFTALMMTLWAYKCLMMVLFQNKIIYMPGMPPFARGEKISDYASRGIDWKEDRIKSSDGVDLTLLIGEMSKLGMGSEQRNKVARDFSHRKIKEVLILYFQG